MQTTDIVNLLIGGSKIRFQVRLHGDVVECLSGLKITAIERTAGGVTFEIEADGLSTLLRCGDLLTADVLDVSITTISHST